MKYKLLEGLGKVALKNKRGSQEVVSFKKTNYIEHDRWVMIYNPDPFDNNALCLGVRTKPETWFTNDPKVLSKETNRRELITYTVGDVKKMVSTGKWTEHDPWRDDTTLAQWSELSRLSNFQPLSDATRSKGNQVILMSGTTASGKNAISEQFKHLFHASSRGERKGERSILRSDKGNVLAFGAINQDTPEDSIEFISEVFGADMSPGSTCCHMFSPETMLWHWMHISQLEQAVQNLGLKEHLLIPAGLDMAELIKGCFVCQDEEVGTNPKIIYNLPSDLSLIDDWYTKRGKNLEQKDLRISYDLQSGEHEITRADFVNVLVKGKDQRSFGRSVRRIVRSL